MTRYIVGSDDCRLATYHRKLVKAVERANELVTQGDRGVTIEDFHGRRKMHLAGVVTLERAQVELQTEAWRDKGVS